MQFVNFGSPPVEPYVLRKGIGASSTCSAVVPEEDDKLPETRYS